MDHLEIAYKNLIKPSNFIQMFKDEGEFREWADQGSVKDLDCTIKEFESDELYEHCIILKQLIDKKLKK